MFYYKIQKNSSFCITQTLTYCSIKKGIISGVGCKDFGFNKQDEGSPDPPPSCDASESCSEEKSF